MKFIKSIKVNNSSFFQDEFSINFSEKLNCIMGGRGTGKTTLLYFLKSSLIPETENEKIPFSILNNNLNEGEIIVELQIDDEQFLRINKYFGEEPQFYLIPNEEVVPYSRIRSYIEADIYEASAIEEIGRNGRSRLALIDKMDSERINQILAQIDDIRIDIDENAKEILSLNSKITNSKTKFEQYKHTKEEFVNYKKNAPKDLDKEEDNKFSIADKNEKKRNKELKLFENFKIQLKKTDSDLDDITSDFSDFIKNNIEVITDYLNQDIIQKSIDSIINLQTTLTKNIKEYKEQSKHTLHEINLNQIALKKIQLLQQNEFVKLKQKIQKHKTYYKQYNELSKKEEKRKLILKDIKILTDKRNKLIEKRNRLISNFNNKNKNYLKFV